MLKSILVIVNLNESSICCVTRNRIKLRKVLDPRLQNTEGIRDRVDKWNPNIFSMSTNFRLKMVRHEVEKIGSILEQRERSDRNRWRFCSTVAIPDGASDFARPTDGRAKQRVSHSNQQVQVLSGHIGAHQNPPASQRIGQSNTPLLFIAICTQSWNITSVTSDTFLKEK